MRTIDQEVNFMLITQVARKYGLTTDQIRHWEQAGLLPPVKRDEQGIKHYDQSAQLWIEYVDMALNAHMTKEFLQEYVKLAQLGKAAKPARKQFLESSLAKITASCRELAKKAKFLEQTLQQTEGDRDDEYRTGQ